MQAERLLAHAIENDADIFLYQAPFVIEKLINNKTVESRGEAELLFREILRYLWLCDADRSRAFPMFSLRVDEAWHQFALFTPQYRAFCKRYFGRFMHHAPSNAPCTGEVPEASWDYFVGVYRSLYGAAPPPVWRDENSVSADRRLIRERSTEVRRSSDKVELVDEGQTLVRCDAFAEPALEFISRHAVFYVRELPGLSATDRKRLCRALVESGTLRVAR